VGPKRVLKVYLVDTEGKKHLAATGDDLGDAHYHYRSSKPFSKYGVIDCHNRKELTQWWVARMPAAAVGALMMEALYFCIMQRQM
jgi:hypothetical protein